MIGVFHAEVIYLSFEHSLLKVSLHCILIGLGNTLDESYLRIGHRTACSYCINGSCMQLAENDNI